VNINLPYVSRCRWLAITLLALILAASFFLFRPGIVMSDTMTRWAAVFTIAGELNIGWAMEQWLAPTMTIFMLPIGLLGLPTEFFTVFQIGYLMLAGSIWIAMTSSRSPFWIPLTFLLPLVFIYVSFVVPDVWTFAAILIIVGSIFAIESGGRWTPVVLFFMSCIVLFGFRPNALILVPLVSVMVYTGKMIPRYFKGILFALIVISNVLIFATPSWFGFGERTSSAAAPAWELIGMLRIAKESQIPVDSTLTLEGIANTNLAIEKHSFTTVDTVLWGEEAALPSGTILNNSDELKARWLRMIIDHQSLYFRMKMRTYECMFGLCDGYLQTQIGADEPWTILNGLISTYSQPKGISGIVFKFGNWTGYVLKVVMVPAFWLPITLLVFLLNWRFYGRYDRWLIAMICAYMASFFILNQAASFRYMFPVYVVFTAYQVRFIGWLLGLVWRNLIGSRTQNELASYGEWNKTPSTKIR
jgi:hypothetical protein